MLRSSTSRTGTSGHVLAATRYAQYSDGAKFALTTYLTDTPQSQICQFCYNNIKTTMNGLCPACRRPYEEKNIEWKVISPEE